MKRAELKVSNQIFQEYLPAGVTIVGARVDTWQDQTIFLLESETFPEAEAPGEAQMKITRRSPFEVQFGYLDRRADQIECD